MEPAGWSPERRRSARVDLLAELQGHVVALDDPVTVRQLGAHGLTVETAVPLSLHGTHGFRICLDDRAVVVQARVRHSRVQLAGDAVRFVAGLEFVDAPPEAEALIRDLLEALRTRPGQAPG